MNRLGSLLALLLLLPSCKRASPEPGGDPKRPPVAASAKDPLPALLSALAAASTPPPPAPAVTAALKALSEEEKAAVKANAEALGKARSAPKRLPGECPVETTRPAQKGEVLASWMALWKRLGDEFQAKFGKPYPAPATPLTTDAEVRHVITGALDDGKRLWVVELEDPKMGVVQWHVVALLANGKLLLFRSIADHSNGRCRTGPQTAWLEEGELPRVVIESISDELQYNCEGAGGDVAPCQFDKPDPKPVQSFCAPGTYSMRWLFLDIDKQEIPLVLEETGAADGHAERTSRVSLTVLPDGALLEGRGCHGKVPLRP